jgi:methylthioribose-1-phosphate isomerase
MLKPDLTAIEPYVSPHYRTIEWRDGRVIMLDQRRLPQEEVYLEMTRPEQVAEAIRDLAIRGAPAIGIAAAMGLALAARCVEARSGAELAAGLGPYVALFLGTRPTAVNLRWALARLEGRMRALGRAGVEAVREALAEEAQRILAEDVLANVAMGEAGAPLVPQEATVLTHCNAGALATGGWGTALGVIRSARRQGKRVAVLADETRPFLQGARLTAWELHRDGIPVTVITDSMAGHLMKAGGISLVIVGADRIAANGDAANKIGTYSVAVLAREHGIPFYVAAPLSTFDADLPSGDRIPIEERDPREVLEWGAARTAPDGVSARYPAFDVTPHGLITAIITEKGVLRPPYEEAIQAAVGG